ncbi:MAG: DUF424 domain-containing protein [Candidatus Syntropharchaeia archaeon]
MSGMYLKKYVTQSERMIAVCDRELIGKKYREGDLVLDITEDFYKGEIVGEEEVVKELEKATIANLVGEKAVGCAVKHGFIDKKNVLFIGGVPHAQMVVL